MAHTPKNQSEKAILTARRAWCYLVLVLISFLCLFFFYVLIINSTRTHFEIQKGFSLMPGKSIITNFRNVLTDANIPVISGIRNSLLVSACSAALSVYFSALTAYGIYAYNFKFKKAAFALILLIMTMPTQVSALGFLQLISKMGLKNSFIPLIVPSIAAPTVFFFMKQYLDASLPMEIVEAARIDGAGEFYTFNKIVLPIMKPALAVQAIFSFVASWNNYFIPALVLDTADKKDPADPDRSAAQRGLPEVRYGQGVHDGGHRHSAGHRRLPAAVQVHRPRRCSWWRQRLKFRQSAKIAAPSGALLRVKKKAIWNVLRVPLRINSGKNIFYSGKSADFPELLFQERDVAGNFPAMPKAPRHRPKGPLRYAEQLSRHSKSLPFLGGIAAGDDGRPRRCKCAPFTTPPVKRDSKSRSHRNGRSRAG